MYLTLHLFFPFTLVFGCLFRLWVPPKDIPQVLLLRICGHCRRLLKFLCSHHQFFLQSQTSVFFLKREIDEKMWRFFLYILSSPEIVNFWEMTNEKTWRWILCCISPCAKMEDTLHIRWKKQPWIWLLHCNKVSSFSLSIFSLNNVKQKFSRYLTPTL